MGKGSSLGEDPQRLFLPKLILVIIGFYNFIPFSWVQPTHDPSTSACHICGCPDDVVMQGQVTSKKPELSKWISFFWSRCSQDLPTLDVFTPSAKWPKWPIFLVSLRPWCKIALRTMTSMWNFCPSQQSLFRKCCGACHHPTSSASKLQFEGFGCLALISSKFFTSYLPEIAICCSKWALSLFDIVWLKAIFNICNVLGPTRLVGTITIHVSFVESNIPGFVVDVVGEIPHWK